MPSILFASMHGSAAMEIAILCNGAGVKMYTPIYGSNLISTLVNIGDMQHLGSLGVTLLRDSEIKDLLTSGGIDAIFLTTPEQILQLRKNIDPIKKLPFVVRHGVNAFDKFMALETKNFLSPSPHGLSQMPGCHRFLMRKMVPWEILPKSDTYGWQRSGFHSYIHNFAKKWPHAIRKFEMLKGMLDDTMTLDWYGWESPKGTVNDLFTMKSSRGTIHIKDGQVACNAVIRSMAVGTPVLMDRETYKKCFFDGIDGILVEDDIMGVLKMMKKLQDNEFLDEACEDAYFMAKKQFTFTNDLGDEFISFLEKLRI